MKNKNINQNQIDRFEKMVNKQHNKRYNLCSIYRSNFFLETYMKQDR